MSNRERTLRMGATKKKCGDKTHRQHSPKRKRILRNRKFVSVSHCWIPGSCVSKSIGGYCRAAGTSISKALPPYEASIQRYPANSVSFPYLLPCNFADCSFDSL